MNDAGPSQVHWHSLRTEDGEQQPQQPHHSFEELQAQVAQDAAEAAAAAAAKEAEFNAAASAEPAADGQYAASAASGEEEGEQDPTRLVNINEVFHTEAPDAEVQATPEEAPEPADAVEPAAEAEHADEAGQEENAYVDFQETTDLDTQQAQGDAEYVDYQDTVALGTNPQAGDDSEYVDYQETVALGTNPQSDESGSGLSVQAPADHFKTSELGTGGQSAMPAYGHHPVTQATPQEAFDFNYEQDTMVGSNSLISELFDNRRDPWQDTSNSWVASQTPTWQDAYKDPTSQLEQNDAANQSGDPLDRRPPHAAEFVLSLGGNVGGVLAALRDAVHKLQDTPGIELTDVAPLARTAAVTRPDQEPQPDYLNTVIVGLTGLSPRELLAVCHRLEDEAGRVRTERWGIRTLDVDIICYEGVTSDAPDLTLPHPRAHERAFVLLPWSFADSELSLDGQDTAQLADVAPDRDGVRWLALDWLETDNLPTLPTGQYIEPPYADEDSDSSEDQSQDNGQ